MDISEMMERRVADNDVIEMSSGSRREGFRLEGSDVDYMYWPNDHRVIFDMSQSEHYYTENKTLILLDSSESPPGFTLLELLTPTTDREVQSACVPMNDRLYISCLLYTSDAADDMQCVDLGGRRIIKKSGSGHPCST